MRTSPRAPHASRFPVRSASRVPPVPCRRGGRASARLATGALAAALAAVTGATHAQVGVTAVQRSFINLGFETPDLGTLGCRVYIGEQFVPGWTTDHPPQGQENVGNCVTPAGFSAGQQARVLELWRTPRTNGGLTVNARSGSQLAELNAVVESRISQNVCLEQGDTVNWRFSHRGRASATRHDRMRFLVGGTEIVRVGTTNNGTAEPVTTLLGTADSSPAPGGWRDYSGEFEYRGASGITNIGFEAIPVAGGSPTEGNFLDEIQVHLRPFIELSSGVFETVEGTAQGLPELRISGTLEHDLMLDVSVVGGTAVLGQDFTTSSGSAGFSVRVPADIYDGTESISLGLAALGNTAIDGTRTVELRLEADPDQYFTRSTSVCGEEGAARATWSILDDDLDLRMEKTVAQAQAAVGDSVDFTLTVTHLGGVAGDGAVVRDPAVPGLDCSAATPTCIARDGAACPASPPTVASLQGTGVVIPVLPAGGQVEIGLRCVVDPP